MDIDIDAELIKDGTGLGSGPLGSKKDTAPAHPLIQRQVDGVIVRGSRGGGLAVGVGAVGGRTDGIGLDGDIILHKTGLECGDNTAADEADDQQQADDFCYGSKTKAFHYNLL